MRLVPRTRPGRTTLLLLLAALAVRAAQLAGVTTSVDDSVERLRFLERRLREPHLPGAGPGGVITEEWRLVTVSATALAATNLTFRGALPRADALVLVERLAERALSTEARDFDTRAYRADGLDDPDLRHGHAGALGHLGLVLGAECALGGLAHREALRQVGEALALRHAGATDGLIETYPGQVWIPDNAISLAAEALSERCLREDHAAPLAQAQLARWPRDAATGLLPFRPGSGVRGSGAAWNGLALPFIDADFARQQFAAAREAFEVPLWPDATAWREFPREVDGAGDVDSGPLVFGLSPAATGLALAGAAQSGDDRLATRLLRTAEGAGVTVPFGGRNYALAPLVGDALVLAARTATAWDDRFREPGPTQRAANTDDGFRSMVPADAHLRAAAGGPVLGLPARGEAAR